MMHYLSMTKKGRKCLNHSII